LSFKKKAQNWIKLSQEDPIAKILSKNSHFTKIQLETLLIDALVSNIASKHVIYDEKAKLRQTKAKISRGSFNRTLRQAKKNAIQSIYTILLLGYLGILESTDLHPYLEVSNKLKTYTTTLANLTTQKRMKDEQLQTMDSFRQELENILNNLSKPWKTKKT
jgi:hypothetical protein